jgi:nitrite reductase/ring-hydroxylating ferredoxin subunit
VHSISEIAPGQGALLRRGLHMIAAYRDPSGACHLRFATCPHLRGVVHWNAGEQTWDCPCHGSRFDPYGRVVNGPATTDLAPVGGGDLGRGDAIGEPLPEGPPVREPGAAEPAAPHAAPRRSH